jgi:hypothetical protein
MAIVHPAVPEVLPVSQAREGLSQVLHRFKADGLSATPLIFGSHRKPEAVAIPYELFEALLPAIEDVLLAATIRERSGQSEVPWEEALEQLGITQQQVDSVDLGEYVIEGR